MKTLLPNQVDASTLIVDGLQTSAKVNAILPCGTGKTLIALDVARKLVANDSVAIFLPSLALIDQTLKLWRAERMLDGRPVMCICSDSSIGDNDDIEVKLDISVTTTPENVLSFLQREVRPVVFCTYQSTRVLQEGMPEKMSFGLGIFDEAHRTAAYSQDSPWAFALSDKNIRIEKRLFMTATPKHQVAIDVNDGPYSMDDVSVYGQCAYSMSIKEAVDQGIICDYEVIVSVVTGKEVSILADHRTCNQQEERFVGAAIAIQKAMMQSGAKKAFLYTSTIAEARVFAEHPVVQKVLSGIPLFHVSGSMKGTVRRSIMANFEAADAGIVTNARCLSEGVDIPTVDMVIFLTNKRSTIDIVQTVGRAQRNSPGKTTGYILLPVYLDENTKDINAAISQTEMGTIFEVLSSMAEQEQITAYHPIIPGNIDVFPYKANRLEKWKNYQIIGDGVDPDILRKNIDVKFVQIMGLYHKEMLEKLLQFHQVHGHFEVSRERDEELYEWLTKMIKRKRDGNLAPWVDKAMSEMGFNWEQRSREYEWRKKLLEMSPRWVASQREKFKKNQLHDYQIEALKAVNFKFIGGVSLTEKKDIFLKDEVKSGSCVLTLVGLWQGESINYLKYNRAFSNNSLLDSLWFGRATYLDVTPFLNNGEVGDQYYENFDLLPLSTISGLSIEELVAIIKEANRCGAMMKKLKSYLKQANTSVIDRSAPGDIRLFAFFMAALSETKHLGALLGRSECGAITLFSKIKVKVVFKTGCWDKENRFVENF